MQSILVDVLIGAPLVLGLLAWVAKGAARTFVITAAALLTMVAGGAFAFLTGYPRVEAIALPHAWAGLSLFLEPLILAAVLAVGFRIKSFAVIGMAVVQIGLAVAAKLSAPAAAHGEVIFRIDTLSIVMVLIISIIGSLIVLFGIGYMRKHAEHHSPTAASDGRFFFVVIAFLGLMNGLVLTDDLKWLGIFWEGTTLCSFFLIGHEGTDEAKASARRAIVINTFGGVMMSLAAFLAVRTTHSESIAGLKGTAAMVPLALLCISTMTKSAQMPFQSWLLGAMVAPTPVSALLHSSTMVKAGSYLILRLTPALAGTPVTLVVAIAGAFTFAVASALAIGQANGKRVLAYSTIANLGLIAACAGINNPLAYSAAITVLGYHAVSKALLFLCMGAIEQTIGSRNIEDMGGILFKMPMTTLVAIVGMVSMFVPPFGMLLGKWMAIEAAVYTPPVLVLFVAGSALTVFFWAKWIGRITTVAYHPNYKMEKISLWMLVVLAAMAAGVIGCSIFGMVLFRHVVEPFCATIFAGRAVDERVVGLMTAIEHFLAWPLVLVFALVGVAVLLSLGQFRRTQVRLPFMCGENVTGVRRTFEFKSLMDRRDVAMVASYYMSSVFGEAAIVRWANPVAALIVLTVLGVLFI